MILTILFSLVVATCILLIVFRGAFRRFVAGKQFTGQQRLDGKTVIITGANTGIGKETALELAKRGGRVILACRDQVKAEQAANEIREDTGSDNVIVGELDLASLESVRKFATHIKETEERLDLLINNAGVFPVFQKRSQTKDGFEVCFGVNHLGHFLLTNLLLDLLEKSTPSRVINVSAHMHFFSKINFDDLNSEKKSYWGVFAYAQSKLANIMFTRELAKRSNGVLAYSLHPGVIHTEIVKLKPGFKKWLHKKYSNTFLKTPAEGIQTILYCALSDDVIDKNGLYFSDCSLSCPIKDGFDEEKCARLWKISEELVGLTIPTAADTEGKTDDSKELMDEHSPVDKTEKILKELVEAAEDVTAVETVSFGETAQTAEKEELKRTNEQKDETAAGIAEFIVDKEGEADISELITDKDKDADIAEFVTDKDKDADITEFVTASITEKERDDQKTETEPETVAALSSDQQAEQNTANYVLDFEQNIPEAISLGEADEIKPLVSYDEPDEEKDIVDVTQLIVKTAKTVSGAAEVSSTDKDGKDEEKSSLPGSSTVQTSLVHGDKIETISAAATKTTEDISSPDAEQPKPTAGSEVSG